MVLAVLFPGALLTLPFLLQGIDTALELGSPTHLLLWEDPLPSLDFPPAHIAGIENVCEGLK